MQRRTVHDSKPRNVVRFNAPMRLITFASIPVHKSPASYTRLALPYHCHVKSGDSPWVRKWCTDWASDAHPLRFYHLRSSRQEEDFPSLTELKVSDVLNLDLKAASGPFNRRTNSEVSPCLSMHAEVFADTLNKAHVQCTDVNRHQTRQKHRNDRYIEPYRLGRPLW